MTRYTVTNQQATEAFLEPSPDGNWVWYSDAAAELEALNMALKASCECADKFKADRDYIQQAAAAELEALTKENTELKGKNIAWVENEQLEMIRKICDSTKHKNPIRDIMRECRRGQPKIVCLCGSVRFADEFRKQELEHLLRGEIALMPCCMFTDIQRTYGEGSDYKKRAAERHKELIDLSDEVLVLNVGKYIGESTGREIEYAKASNKPVKYLIPQWECDLGNGEWDHDWYEKHDDSGQVDGGPGDHWSWRVCRVCGETEAA